MGENGRFHTETRQAAAFSEGLPLQLIQKLGFMADAKELLAAFQLDPAHPNHHRHECHASSQRSLGRSGHGSVTGQTCRGKANSKGPGHCCFC